MSDKDNEQVLTVSASRVRDLFGVARWIDADEPWIEESELLLDLGASEFLRRGDCETDVTRKHAALRGDY